MEQLDDMIVDGALGEGGGQVVRSAMCIAAVTGRTVEVRNVRARRSPPGLKAQHVTAARAAAEICGGELSGAELGSKELRLQPGELRGGDYCFDIGTAGSTMLVLQTVLPALLFAPQRSKIDLVGGTHNTMAPSWEFVERVYLPMLRRMGADVSYRLDQRGFFPRGGGRVIVEVEPAPLRPLAIMERGECVKRRAIAICAQLPREIGVRETDTIVRSMGWRAREAEVIEDGDTLSPGNVAMIELQFPDVGELICEHGRVGLRAEKVAKRAVRQARAYLDADVPVGEHLADQLMTPLALMAWRAKSSVSRFRTLPLTQHAKTLAILLPQLLGVAVSIAESPRDAVVTIGDEAGS
ncbi:MAG: RNA 3'-terminal phosphate cyclase [Planctomycetales bacterium]|nr:RNA 3'-terminal phosphate cyclase [Planctomycetales bacterium]